MTRVIVEGIKFTPWLGIICPTVATASTVYIAEIKSNSPSLSRERIKTSMFPWKNSFQLSRNSSKL